MKAEIIVGIVIGWFVLRAVAKSLRANKAKLQRGGEVNQNPANLPQENVGNSGVESRSKEGRSLEREVTPKSREVVDPFMEALSLEEDRDHYNEEELTTQYEQTHAQGKTVEHHKHKLFDGAKDRQKAAKHKGSSGGAAVKSSGLLNKKQERRAKKVHPLMAALREKGGRKQAFLMGEILKRDSQD